MSYRALQDKIYISETLVLTRNEKDYRKRKRKTIHYDSKLRDYLRIATSLCGSGSVYSQYTLDTKEVTCKRCRKKLQKETKKV